MTIYLDIIGVRPFPTLMASSNFHITLIKLRAPEINRTISLSGLFGRMAGNMSYYVLFM